MNENRARFTSNDIIFAVVIAGMICAVVVPAFMRHQASVVDAAVTANLTRLAAAAEQHFLEKGVTSVQVGDLLPPKGTMAPLVPVAGETYPVTVVQGDALTARNVAGVRSVALGAGASYPTAAASQLITPVSPIQLRVIADRARASTPETLTPVTTADLARMPGSYEWGSGPSHRAWRRVDATLWHEVYPDGRYSQFPIIGRATVNGVMGTIAAKDDGSLTVFIPDKGGRMVHQIRGVGGAGPFSDHMPMENVR